MTRAQYTIKGTEVKVVNWTSAKVTYIRVSDKAKFVVGTRWFKDNANRQS